MPLQMPNWFIRNRMIPLSARRPKFPKREFGKLCMDCFCDLDKEIASIHFAQTLQGRDKYRCHLCWQKNLTHERSRYLPAAYMGAEEEETPKGNLDNWMYRYFMGSRDPNSKEAICRCCRETVNDDRKRRQHT